MLVKPLEKTIVGRWINLREIRESDTDAIVSIRSREGRKYLGATDSESHLNWLRNRYQPADNDYNFVIEDRRSNSEVIGAIALYNIDWQGGFGEWGRWVIKEGPCRKYAPLESVFLLFKFGFDSLGLAKIYCCTRKSNKNVIDFHLRFGHELEEVKQKAVFDESEGSYDDVCVMAMTQDRFQSLAKGLESVIAGLQKETV